MQNQIAPKVRAPWTFFAEVALAIAGSTAFAAFVQMERKEWDRMTATVVAAPPSIAVPCARTPPRSSPPCVMRFVR